MALTHRQLFTPSNLKMLVLTTSIFFVLSYNVALAQDSGKESAEVSKANDLIEKRDFAKALEVSIALTQKYPNNSMAWFYLGVSAIETQRYKEGTEAFRKSIELQSTYAPAHTFLADALLKQGALPQAWIQVDEALALTPADPYANYTKARIRFQQKLYSEAASSAENAYLEKPDFADAYLLRAEALIGNYRNFETVEDSEKQNIITRYRSAADALEKYTSLATTSKSATFWFDQIELLRNFPIEGNGLPSQKPDKRVQIISKPEPSYTEEARKNQISGTVVLRALFDVDGTVKKIFVCQALRGGLTEKSAQAAAQIKFVPATLNGVPVVTWMQLEYNFQLF